MSGLVFVTGGARSGKSRFAQSLAESRPGPLLYVASAEPGDPEMTERIARHRAQRGPRWRTLEEPLNVAERLPAEASGTGGVLFDCLTIWLANLFEEHARNSEAVLGELDRLLAVVAELSVPVVVVANEVGGGIVPENSLARAFRDLAGLASQRLAAAAAEAWLVVAGLPLRLK